jgi:hypothetical protein
MSNPTFEEALKQLSSPHDRYGRIREALEALSRKLQAEYEPSDDLEDILDDIDTMANQIAPRMPVLQFASEDY